MKTFLWVRTYSNTTHTRKGYICTIRVNFGPKKMGAKSVAKKTKQVVRSIGISWGMCRIVNHLSWKIPCRRPTQTLILQRKKPRSKLAGSNLPTATELEVRLGAPSCKVFSYCFSQGNISTVWTVPSVLPAQILVRRYLLFESFSKSSCKKYSHWQSKLSIYSDIMALFMSCLSYGWLGACISVTLTDHTFSEGKDCVFFIRDFISF